MQNRIELVGVAAGAAVSHGQESGADGIGDVVQDLLAALHQVAGVAFIRIVPVESRGDAGLGIVRPQFIAGDLLLDEAVIGLVLVERLDDVIAVAPGIRPRLVALESFAFGVAGEIQPVPRPAFAIVRRSEQAVDHLFVRVGRFVGDEGVDFFGRGGSPIRSKLTRRSRVMRSAAAAGLQALASQFREDERVDRIGVAWRSGRLAGRCASPAERPSICAEPG